MNTLFLKRRNLASIAAVDDVDLGVAVDIAHEPDAASAENAAIPVQHQRGTEVDVRFDAFAVEHASGKVHATFGRAKRVGEILKGAFAALVADGAVERVIDQQEFEDA